MTNDEVSPQECETRAISSGSPSASAVGDVVAKTELPDDRRDVAEAVGRHDPNAGEEVQPPPSDICEALPTRPGLLLAQAIRLSGQLGDEVRNRETLRTLFARDSIVLWHFQRFRRKRARMRAWSSDPTGPVVHRFTSPRQLEDWLRRTPPLPGGDIRS